MKIHFCDLCNESVPQGDLDQGRAFVRKGRVVCATCDRAMSHAHGAEPARAGSSGPLAAAVERAEVIAPPAAGLSPAGAAPLESAPSIAPAAAPASVQPAPALHHAPAGAPARSGGSGVLWLALLALIFAGGAAYVLDERIQALSAKEESTLRQLDKTNGALGLVERRATLAEEAARDLEKRLALRIDAQKPRYTAIEEDLAKLVKAGEAQGARLLEIGRALEDLQAKSGTPSVELQQRLDQLSARIAKGEDEARALRGDIEAVRALAEAVPAPVTPEVPKPVEAAWKATLPDLASSNETLRWEAVDQLGKSEDQAVVPYVVPMLKDANIFVRMAAARVLGNLQAKSATPALIDALEDVETAVREQAYVALQRATGKDFKFDPGANEGERSKRVKTWREWWKKESEAPAGS